MKIYDNAKYGAAYKEADGRNSPASNIEEEDNAAAAEKKVRSISGSEI